MTAVDPITLQVLIGRLRSICDEMGAVLIRSAHSANIKERRDCSTAVFDARGELVMQAEHIPVHLGSMPDAVAAILDRPIGDGRTWILNDPFAGGTHLPDITLITPVFPPGSTGVLGFVASRAHHADVGGRYPGSMPAGSRSVADEGVLISPRSLGDPAELIELTHQMRNPDQRMADLRAQWAANQVGRRRMLELAEASGTDLGGGMKAILDYSELRARTRLGELPDGSWEAADVLEGGADGSDDIGVQVRVTLLGEDLRIDFKGSADQVDGNLNCPLSVTRSATLFAVRVLVDPEAPPSAGAHRPVTIVAPEGSILNAAHPAAVAAGNVETSSRVADLVLTALGEAAGGPAQGQGTMNNVTLAGEGWTHYETTGGGQGACARAPGPDAIHVAMSNTLNTPVEALESELPLRVRELAIRRGSGGAGRYRGGDGLIREIEALEPVSYSLITERRRHAPKGRSGGQPGRRGRNLVNGAEVPAKADGTLAAGDSLRIETPGGGGHGTPPGE